MVEYMAKLGVRSIDELVGRADLLEADESAMHDKNRGIDLSALLIPAQQLNPQTGIIKSIDQVSTLLRIAGSFVSFCVTKTNLISSHRIMSCATHWITC